MKKQIEYLTSTLSGFVRTGCVAVLLLTLAACNSGGGGVGDSNPSASVLTGRFVDGPVAGLRYQTPTRSGETNASGEFQYLADEVVSFYVGDIKLGQVAGADTITPFDLAGISPPQSALDTRREANRASNKPPAPIETVANIAAFLQTLDADGDPANGIEIPAAMHGLAAGASLDFHRKWWAFKGDFALRKLIAAGRNAGLWGGTRAIRNPFYALDALYAGLGLTPTIYATSSFEVDSGADGTVDSRSTYTYDANGNLTLSETDSNVTADSRTTYAYDANGNQTLQENDYNADGTVDFRTTYAYDANGNRTLSEQDNKADGKVDRRETYTYDADGNLTLVERDSNADGTADSRTTYTYDANGNLTLSETDSNADGTADYRQTSAYDANGNQTLLEEDSNVDGTVDSRVTYTYDANGNQTLREWDSNADGAVDSRETSAYDANGNLTLLEGDSNVDGTVDSRVTYAYNADGNWTLSEVDYNADGAVDSRSTQVFSAINRWTPLFNEINPAKD